MTARPAPARAALAEVLALRSVLALRRRGVPAASAVRTAAGALPSLAPIADALERGAVPAPQTLAERALAKGDALAVDDLALVVDDVARAAALREAERRSERPFVALIVGGALVGCVGGWASSGMFGFLLPELLPDVTRAALTVLWVMRFGGPPLAVLALVAHRRGLLRKRLPGERAFAVLAALRMGAPLEGVPLDDHERAFGLRMRARKGEAAAARALALAIEDEVLPDALRQRRTLFVTMTVAMGAVGVLAAAALAAPLTTIAQAIR